MDPVERHAYEPDVSFDGGDLDCGNGLLLLIRQHIDPLARGQLLEFRSTEISVEADFPAWCRMTGYELISLVRRGRERSFLVCKGALAERPARPARQAPASILRLERGEIEVLAALPSTTRVGVGVVNQKHERVESVDEIVAQGRRAIALGAGRVLLTPDCGFATFADNPVASAQVAEGKLLAISRAAEILRRG